MFLIPDQLKEGSFKKVIDDFPAEVVYKSLCNNFEFNCDTSSEVDKFCREKGYKLDKVVICSYLFSDLGVSEEIKSETKSRLFVIKEKEKLVGILYINTEVIRKK